MSAELNFLEEEIASDIAEREELMARIKLLPKLYNFSKQDEHLFLNYSIPIIYSTWEGFVQTAFQVYIRELNKLGLSIDNICDQILVYHLESTFLQFKQYPRSLRKEDEPRKLKQKVDFFNELQQFYKLETFQIYASVNTESNVWFSTLNRILRDFNLQIIPEYPEPKYSLKVELDRLLDTRNKVAHGQNSVVVNEDDLKRAITVVEKLMDLVFDRIKTGFIEQSYRKSPQNIKLDPDQDQSW